MILNVESIERTVIKLRKRFDSLLSKIGGPHRLAKRLGEIDDYFNTQNGYNDVRNAKREKAGEEVMIRILNAMEQLVKIPSVSPSINKTDKSLKRMGLIYEPKYETTQKLKEKMQTSKPK